MTGDRQETEGRIRVFRCPVCGETQGGWFPGGGGLTCLGPVGAGEHDKTPMVEYVPVAERQRADRYEEALREMAEFTDMFGGWTEYPAGGVASVVHSKARAALSGVDEGTEER